MNHKLFNHPRYFYKMFQISPKVFMSLHDLLVSSYGLKSTTNVASNSHWQYCYGLLVGLVIFSS
jgi:hypothetical protein